MECRIKDNNPFWTHYLSLEKELQEISEYVSIHKDNLSVFSFKIMQLYFAVCTDIDSIFKHIQSNINVTKSRLTVEEHIQMLNDKFPLVRNTIVELKFSGQVLEFTPFEPLFVDILGNILLKTSKKNVKFSKCNFDHYNIFYKYPLNKYPLKKHHWWKDYNSVKHSRSDNFHKANLDNLLNSLSALHILNLVYQVSLDEKWIKDYQSIPIEAPALYHYPFFRLKSSYYGRRTGDAYGFYLTSLDNKMTRSASAEA